MSIQWHDLGAGFAIYLVLEGMLPFLSPPTLKRTLAALGTVPDQQLRRFGLISMMGGCLLLFLIRS
jgi:uncharacterized protein